MTRRLMLLAGELVLCGCKDDQKEKTKAVSCSQLLECISVAQSSEYPAALQAYGPDSSQLQTMAELYPETPQCLPPATDAGVGGDGGSTLGG